MKPPNGAITLRNLRKLVVRPGEVLVLMTDMILSTMAQERILKQLRTAMPGQKVMILEEGMKLAVVRPNKETA